MFIVFLTFEFTFGFEEDPQCFVHGIALISSAAILTK